MKENQLVQVTYPDNKGNHKTTVSFLRRKWSHESMDWQKMFFDSLSSTGKAHSRFGEYTLLDEYEL